MNALTLKSYPRNSKPVLIIGAGGQARVVLAIVNTLKEYRPLGILDLQRPEIGEKIGDSEVIGWAEELTMWRSECEYAALAIGDNRKRLEWARRTEEAGYRMPTLVHSTAVIDRNAALGPGAVVCAGAIVGCEVDIGPYSIINSGAQVDHECRVGVAAHIGPGGLLGGRVHVEDGAFVGIGTVIKENINVGAWSVIGAGSVVIRDVPAGATVYGCPAKQVAT